MTEKQAVKDSAAQILAGNGPVEAAHFLARTLFRDKVDQGGQPYLGHLARVAAGVGESEKPIAWLHDVVEDIAGWDYADLRGIGFDAYVIDGVRAVTKLSEDEPYFRAIERAGRTAQAIPVKRSDLRDNSNLFRLNRIPTDRDIARVQKYFVSDKYLADIQSGKTVPGTTVRAWMGTQPKALQSPEMLRKHSGDAPRWVAPMGFIP